MAGNGTGKKEGEQLKGRLDSLGDGIEAKPALDKEAAKAARIEKEKKELLASLAAGDFSTMIPRVASVLNLYPLARNSDVSLALKYWATFQPDVYKEHGILPADLFKLERLHYLVRARAKIQNEYHLFTADEKVRRFRRKNEETMREEVLQETAPRRVLHVFSDETGKNQRYVIVASVWALTGIAVFKVATTIANWQKTSMWKNREVHFARFGRQDQATLEEYLSLVAANREFLSFKVMAVEKAKTRRPIEEVVARLHEHMLVRGAAHEIENKRIELPQNILVAVDEEQSLDAFALAEMRNKVTGAYRDAYGDRFDLSELRTVSSRHAPLIQLADVIAGALNRRLSHEAERNFKDEMADMVIERLGLALTEEGLTGLDASALFMV